MGAIESREVICLNSGSECHIADFASSKIQIIDNAQKVHQALQQLNRAEDPNFFEIDALL